MTFPEILFENDDVIAINKPPGLLSIPDRQGKELSLKELLLRRFSSIFVVHRLDKFTSGVIVFAKNAEAHKNLSRQFEDRLTEKYYVGLVHGTLKEEKGIIESSLMEHPSQKNKMIVHAKGKPALTGYEVLEAFQSYAWLKFRLHTGRMHQIRVHMQSLGNSLVCDDIYGNGAPLLLSGIKSKYKLSKNAEEEQPLLSRLALHSFSLSFQLNAKMYVEAQPPKDLRAVLQQLRKWG